MSKNSLIELLGTARTEKLRDEIAKLILKQVEEDLEQAIDYTVDVDRIAYLVDECYDEVKVEIKKKLLDKYEAEAVKIMEKMIRGDKQ